MQSAAIKAPSLNFNILTVNTSSPTSIRHPILTCPPQTEMGINGEYPLPIIPLLPFIFTFVLRLTCQAANTITQIQSVADGETIVSANGNFALGFFSPGNSSSRYVGIWYNKISAQSIVWVANREKAVSSNAGVLKIGSDGNLLILDGNGSSIWSTNVSVSMSSNDSVAVLMDSGNLVISSSNDVGDLSKAYWQSFNHPTDTYLPGMRVRVNTQMGENHAFTSWRSATDPSPGNYSLGVDPRGAPQIVLWEGLNRRWRSGQWNLQIFTGVPNMTSNYLYGFKLSPHEADGSMYFTYVPSTSTDLLRFWIRWDGVEEELRWVEATKKWFVYQSQPANECELYNRCGNFGKCSVTESPICSCMKGFVPRNVEEWNKGNWTGGCVRRVNLQCQRNSSVSDNGDDGFLAVKCLKFPDFADQVVGASEEACKDECQNNCSCKAYAHADGIGCMLWKEDLVDIQHFDKAGETLYIRLASSELGGKRKLSVLAIILIAIGVTIFLGIFILAVWKFRAKFKDLPKKGSSISWWKSGEISNFEVSKSEQNTTEVSGQDVEGNPVDGTELQQFNFKSIAAATDNFSEENELGKGGFGPVYKGKLPGGQEVAVKRLSRMSGQGLEEFKNEIILIAKLQHRNLVRILGCCIEGEEKILLYEYMPNKSLDYFLFDPAYQAQLDWAKRFTIIEGIARGLLYLHRDSRLRIIHRDLKASNILLDEEMNPKISDFGMARIFGGNQNDEANTIRVVGTYGYMSPEYAMEGLFSVKSDVYSFGVLLLEIVSGRRNTSFRSSEHASLIGYAWHLWNEGKTIELLDPSIKSSYSRDEVLRCIQIGVLCVQDSAVSRPTMSSVVLMLESDTATLPFPRQPTFTSMRTSLDSEFYMECHDLISSSDVTVTTVHGR